MIMDMRQVLLQLTVLSRPENFRVWANLYPRTKVPISAVWQPFGMCDRIWTPLAPTWHFARVLEGHELGPMKSFGASGWFHLTPIGGKQLPPSHSFLAGGTV